MTKFVSFLSTIVLVLLLSACSQNTASQQADTPSNTQTKANLPEGGEAEGEGENEGATEREISTDEVPEMIKKAIQTGFPGAELVEAEEITGEDGSIIYVVEMKYKDKVMEMRYDANGKFLGIDEAGN